MKLKITKNKKTIDVKNQFTYIVEIYDDQNNFYDEYIFKIPSTKYMTPDDESFNYEGILNQLKMCHEVTENNFSTEMVEIEEIIIE